MSGTRFMGLDLGGTNIKVAVLDHSEGAMPEVIYTTQYSTHAEGGPSVVTERLIEAGRTTADKVGSIAAVGVGVPGLFDAESGEIEMFPNLPGPWPGYALRDPIADALSMPASIINDARAFVLAEGTIGAGRGHSPLIGITLGTGIGGGIMIDGRLQLGAFGKAGEIAHQIIVIDGPLCGCGNRGCVEALAKADVLVDLAGAPDVETVFQRAESGDEQSIAAIDTVARYIGIGLANVVTLIGPSCIVVGGGIAAAGNLILDPIRKAMRSRVTLAPVDQVEVVPAELGSFAGAIGAALTGSDQSEVRIR